MRLEKQLLTRNDCYTEGRTITPLGVMVHSTGSNNPRVSRYVPGNEVLGCNIAGNHWNQTDEEYEKKFDRELNKCVHAFIGKFADGGVGTVQTLPWNWRGWHCGSGKKGSGKDTHISFEICEDGLEDAGYFAAVYREAVELTAYLCREYRLNPLADGVVICHQEGYQRGIATNHGDVLHWFPKFGKTMDDFRADVALEMEGGESVTYQEWKAYMEQYQKELAQQPASMPELLEEAKAMGLTNGTSPRALVTREECAVMARAAARFDA